ncbi:MAG TPA: hypothetical protein VH142_23900, partial [Polyangiaceae bacterium]|nr:hypothetical protein [Polyangiaceae bacterium]
MIKKTKNTMYPNKKGKLVLETNLFLESGQKKTFRKTIEPCANAESQMQQFAFESRAKLEGVPTVLTSPVLNPGRTLKEVFDQSYWISVEKKLASNTASCKKGVWNNIILPELGSIPIDSIDSAAVASFRESLSGRIDRRLTPRKGQGPLTNAVANNYLHNLIGVLRW